MMMKNAQKALAVLLLAGSFASTSGTALAAGINSGDLATVLQSLEKADGKLTPVVRAMYLHWSEQAVSNELAATKISLPADCWNEVQSDSTLRDAMFGAVYPPDPSILQNYASLRTALGLGFLNKYHSLIIAVAVAKRVEGLMTNNDFTAQDGTKGNDADYFSDFETNLRPNEADNQQQLTRAIAKFMRAYRISALNLYQNPNEQQQLLRFLNVQGIDPAMISRIEDPKHFGAALMGAMIVLGQRPANREPEPDLVTWLRYLASEYESTPTSMPIVGKKKQRMPWPLFSMDKCPWPLLMPLSRTLPIGEARYIWETFQGEHGTQRYHTYGPYRKRDKELLYELQPSPWHWNSWQDRIVHGGVCIVMAGIAVDTHIALCEPAVRASQPHHANLIAYHNLGGLWVALIEQSFAGGPAVTRAAWLFQDGESTPRLLNRNRCYSEYQLGLAAGMNLGLRQYIDTRIAVNIFNALPGSEKKTIGVKLLCQAIQTNPYNPAAWYLLARENPTLAQDLLSADTSSINMTQKISKRLASRDLEGIVEKNGTPIVEIQIQRYWQTVAEFVTNPVQSGGGALSATKEFED